MANQTAAQKAEAEALAKEEAEKKALAEAEALAKEGNKSFVTCHSGTFNAGGVEFNPGVAVELTAEQQELPAIKNAIGNMLKEA